MHPHPILDPREGEQLSETLRRTLAHSVVRRFGDINAFVQPSPDEPPAPGALFAYQFEGIYYYGFVTNVDADDYRNRVGKCVRMEYTRFFHFVLIKCHMRLRNAS